MASWFLSARAVWETFLISAPTIVDGLFGRVTIEKCDVRLRRWATRLLDQADVTRVIEGAEHATTDEVFVVMSNHQSLNDIPLLIESYPHTLRMVTKTELFRVPIWGGAMRESGFIELDRNNRVRAREGIENAKKRLAQGINVWIAPEGTRSRSGSLGEFKSGGFRLAQATGFRILPVAIRGTQGVLPADGLRVLSGAKVEMQFGEPVNPAEFASNAKRVELVKIVRDAIQKML